VQPHFRAWASGSEGTKRLLGATVALLKQRQTHPEGDRGGGQRHSDGYFAAWRKCPIERRPQIVDLLGVVGQPFARRPRRHFTFGALEKIAIVRGVAERDPVALAALVKLFDRVAAGRVEQPEPRFSAADICDDQRFCHQISQAVDRIDLCPCYIHSHGCGSLDGKAAREEAESPEEPLLVLAQQTVAPIDNGSHRSVPRHRRATPPLQQQQAVVQAGGKSFDAKHLDARCGELDRQWQAVKPPANLDDQRGIHIDQREVFDGRGDTLDEQLNSGESRRLGGRQIVRRLRADTVVGIAVGVACKWCASYAFYRTVGEPVR
jgi:hypothetical protein